jgi:uncharacterized protein (TIGR00369 family)
MPSDQTPEPSQAELVDFFNKLGAGTLLERMGIVITEATEERIVGTMPVEGNTQVYGLLHGGASVVLAETLGSLSSALHAGQDKQVVGIDINATHHRSATSGLVTGVATPVHVGRTLIVNEIVITDEQGRRCCTSRITCMVKG